MNDKYFWAGIACIILACTIGMCCISCNNNKPKVTDEKPVTVEVPEGSEVKEVKVDNRTEVKNESVQVSNSVWPWVIVVLINNAMWFAYLYMSKKFLGFGRR